VRDADGFVAHTALVHADGQTPDLPELIAEVAERTAAHYVFGGLSSGRGALVQFARSSRGAVAGRGQRGASGVFDGGLSGVAFAPEVPLLTRVSQGVRAVAAPHVVTEADHHLVLGLDDRPALEVLLQDLGLRLEEPREAVQRLRQILVGVTSPEALDRQAQRRPGQIGEDLWVRHLIGLDPARQALAMADQVPEGARLVWCERHQEAARADLMRMGTEIRAALEPEHWSEEMAAWDPAQRMVGALYVSCSGRGGPHFGAPHAELQIVRRALGDVPLVGFFAAGEIAHHRLYGYTGVLTVFVADAP
jgi:small ligand-binding sensory domain FIST